MNFNNFNIIWNGNSFDSRYFINFKSKYAIKKLKQNKSLILMKRSPDLICSICMCLEKGITYIPIDPTYPKDRLKYIIDNANPNDIMSDVELDIKFVPSLQTISVEEDVVYILYTSGTTGTPKGVKVTWEGLLNFIEGISEIIDFSPGKRIACFTTVAFDIFFLESIMALYKGLTVVLANEDEQRNPRLMAKLIHDNAVDMVQMTPSRMQVLLNHDKELSCLKNVKEIMIGGEAFPLGLLKTLQAKTNAKIYNMYGPTETTIWSTVSDLTQKDRIDIGRPIKNTEVYIVDESLSILPDGQVGEICIAGKGLARGYVGKNDVTMKKFIYLPQKPNVRVYRTGDIGRYLPDGDLEYLGRSDNQVKIRGHRVELEEIESHLNQIKEIHQAVVIALETNETDKILQAFYTSDATLDQKEITDYLSSKLPEYMIPVRFKRVESFFQTENGKIDRKRVLQCVEIKTGDDLPEEFKLSELNAVSQKAFRVIKSTLDPNNENMTLETSFVEAGVDSITFVNLVVALESEFNFEWDDEMLLFTAFPTLRNMIDYVESKVSGSSDGEKDDQ